MNRSLGDKQERDQLKVITVGIVLLSLYSLVSMVLWSFRWLVHYFDPVTVLANKQIETKYAHKT